MTATPELLDNLAHGTLSVTKSSLLCFSLTGLISGELASIVTQRDV